jgi:hypothetical protein
MHLPILAMTVLTIVLAGCGVSSTGMTPSPAAMSTNQAMIIGATMAALRFGPSVNPADAAEAANATYEAIATEVANATWFIVIFGADDPEHPTRVRQTDDVARSACRYAPKVTMSHHRFVRPEGSLWEGRLAMPAAAKKRFTLFGDCGRGAIRANEQGWARGGRAGWNICAFALINTYFRPKYVLIETRGSRC